MHDTLDALLARPSHRTLRYAAPGSRLHHRRAGWVATEEPDCAISGFGHRLILPSSPFDAGLDVWLDRWRAEPRSGQPRTAYFVWETDRRDVQAEALAARTDHALYVLRPRAIEAPPDASGRIPPPGPPGLRCRALVGDDDWRAVAEMGGRAFWPDDEAGKAFGRWATDSRRGRIEAGQGQEWGAFLDGRLVGGCGLMFDPDTPGEARFQDVATDPDFAGRKIVSNLLAETLTAFFDGGGRRAWILADVDSRPDRIYAALGFVARDWFYELGVSVVPGEAG